MKPKGREEREKKKLKTTFEELHRCVCIMITYILSIFLNFNFQNISVLFKIVICEHFKIRYAISGVSSHHDEKVTFLFISLDNLL